MEQHWRKYESLVLYSGEMDLAASEEMLERVRDIIRGAGGRMIKTERWGLKEMAFAIKRHKKAYYALLEYAGPAAVSTELAHQLNLIDDIVKFQTVKLDDRVDPAALPETEEIIGKEPVEKPAEEATAAEEPAEEATVEEDAPAEEMAEEDEADAEEDEEEDAE